MKLIIKHINQNHSTVKWFKPHCCIASNSKIIKFCLKQQLHYLHEVSAICLLYQLSASYDAKSTTTRYLHKSLL